MSRLGKIPVQIPVGVDVKIADGEVRVKGPKAELSTPIIDGVDVRASIGAVDIVRKGDSRGERSAHGLMRRLVANMVEGVSGGFTRTLEIQGVGYRADAKGALLHLSLGYSHPIVYQLPEGVSATVQNQTIVTLTGADRQLVGEVAANIRKLRPPEPYKGKGIRYSDEQVRRKAGKAGKA